MTRRERQEREIATIKERTLKIRLSDADVLRICEKAGAHGITAAQMVESYLMDLVGGTYTNGSDERECASAYFERCWYGAFPEETFLRYLIEWGNAEEYIENMEAAADYRKEIEEYSKRQELDEDEQTDLEYYREELELAEGVLADYYEEYCANCHDREPEPIEDAQCGVVKWYAEYKELKGEKDE